MGRDAEVDGRVGEGALGSQGWEASHYVWIRECFAERAKFKATEISVFSLLLLLLPLQSPRNIPVRNKYAEMTRKEPAFAISMAM